MCVIQVAGISFRRARTTVEPTRPDTTSSLITTGIYGITRNPIYVGMALMLLGWAIFLLNIASFVMIAVFVAYIWRFQITPEERALSILFKNEYTAYKSKVRRWL
jgi:protein-S-isoprenylcysteine O-methyltransferase Ste14